MGPDRARLVEHLSRRVTPRRLRRMRTVLAERTRWITVVLEEVYQPHNASAVLRSCECFGVQEVHVVEERNEFRVSRDRRPGRRPVARRRPLERRRDPGHRALLRRAGRQGGYRLAAATPADDAASLDDLDPGRGPVAVLFGTELEGLTAEALRRCPGEGPHPPRSGSRRASTSP